jgi:hypothetical protein
MPPCRHAAMPPQALPKFNLAKQPVSAIPNRPFTSYSREKREPRLIAIVGAGRKYAGNERQGR